jgi:predicted GNAT family acetyltransferase
MSETIADNRERRRYEIRLDGEVAGFAQYRSAPERIALTHTEIDDRFEGQGLGGRLVAFALDDARERGLAVLPFCPFVAGYIQRHRQYVELVPEDRRAEFDLPNWDVEQQ